MGGQPALRADQGCPDRAVGCRTQPSLAIPVPVPPARLSTASLRLALVTRAVGGAGLRASAPAQVVVGAPTGRAARRPCAAARPRPAARARVRGRRRRTGRPENSPLPCSSSELLIGRGVGLTGGAAPRRARLCGPGRCRRAARTTMSARGMHDRLVTSSETTRAPGVADVLAHRPAAQPGGVSRRLACEEEADERPARDGTGARQRRSPKAGSHGGTEAQEPAVASVPKGADGITLATIAPP